MAILDLISQVCLTLSVTNTFFAFFFFKKHQTVLSRWFFYLVLVSFFNIFLVGFSLVILTSFFPSVAGYEYIYIIGFVFNIITITALMFTIRNLYFIGVDLNEKEKIKLWPVLLVISALVAIPLIVIKDIDLLFNVLFLMMLGTGILHLANFLDLLIRFIRNYEEIKSYVIRKATLIFLIIGGVFIPVLYITIGIDYLLYVQHNGTTQYILDTIGKVDIAHSIRFNSPVLGYHLFFHGSSIFLIARYYFRFNQHSQEILTMEQVEHFNLSRREVEVANLILRGLKNKNIREKLFIADGTLRNHISNIYQKAQVKSREEFVSRVRAR